MVLQYNWAYGPYGFALNGKVCLNAITAGGSREIYGPEGKNKYTINEFLRPFEQTASLCGMHYLPPFAITSANQLKTREVGFCEKEYSKVLHWLSNKDLSQINVSDLQFLNDMTETT